jgi:cytochrome P450
MSTVLSLPAGAEMRRIDELPAPRGLPLLGNLHQVRPDRLHLILERWHAELGDAYRFDIGARRFVVMADAELLQTALRDRPERFRRTSMIESVFREIGANGVFSVEGEAWRPQRKLVMQALALPQTRAFHPTLVAITERLLRRWQRAADAGSVLDMNHELVRYTVDVTTALAFGEDPNTLEHDGDVIQDHLAKVFPMIMRRVNAPFPWWRHLRLPSDRRFDRSMAAVHVHVQGLIARARARLAQDPVPRNVLETLLLEAGRPASGLGDAEVAANVITLLLAGEDTTANTLSWTLFQLAQHPQWQQRLHAQASALFGSAPVCVDVAGLARLDAFEACATEASRLKPTVPLIFLETIEDTELGGVLLPRRSMLGFLLRPPMLDARHFGDPLQFRPERWLRAAGDEAAAVPAAGCPHHAGAAAGAEAPQQCPHHARAFVQFGAGPRVCPGRHLAGSEIRLVLSMLMRNFSIELACGPQEIEEVNAFTMLPSRMPVRMHRRA